MVVYYKKEIKNLKLSNTAVALGGFDSLHIGHIKIIEAAVSYARENDLTPAVYFFRSPFKSGRSVNSFEKRLEILEELGIEIVLADEFTPEIMKLTAEEFFEEYICRRFGARYVGAGYNYTFGANGAGTAETLVKMCGERGIECRIQPRVRLSHTASSTYITRLVGEGRIDEANEYLGRPFSISGKVVRGSELGRTIGFPTANIELPTDRIYPKKGVYISLVNIDGKKYRAITNVGSKPTVVDEGVMNIETNIFDYSGDLYGRTLEIGFCKFIREIEKFESVEALREQLVRDRRRANEYFDALRAEEDNRGTV